MSSVGTLKSVKRMPAPKTLPKIAASDFTRDLDISQDELLALLDLTQQLKSNPSRFAQALAGRYITLLFEKPSLRTRFTFELAIKQLGGDAVLSVGPIGDREPLKDVARNLDRWTNAIVARTFSQNTIDDLAHWSSVPVINALSDRFHPCQALADVFTLQERFGDVRGLKLAFVGDGNNVAHSLMLASLRLGMNFSLATPAGYEPDAEIVAQAEALAAVAGGQLVITNDPVGGGGRRARGLHRRVGQHGPGAREGKAARRFRSLSGERGVVRAGRARRHLPALPARQARRRSDRRRDRIARNRRSSIKPKIVCTCRRRYY